MQLSIRVVQRSVAALVATLVLTALALVAASPASAATIYGPYYNGVTGTYEGNYTYIDCSGSCADDNAITVSNVANGYKVRVRVFALVNGTWYRYLDKITPDDSRAKFHTGYPPAGAKIRIELCTLDSAYIVRGSCTNKYTYNTYY